VLPHGAGPAIAWHAAEINADSETILQRLADDANQAIPGQWWMAQSGEGATDFVRQYDQHRTEQGGTPDPPSVTPGYYLNGELLSPSPAATDPVLGSHVAPDTSEADHGKLG